MKDRRPFVYCLRLLPTLLLLLFTSSQLMAADVSLAWDPSVTPDVTGYRIYFGNASRTYGTPIVIDNQTSYTVTGLLPGTYYFAVTAFDAQGNESDFSNEISQVIGSPDQPVDTTPPIISGVMSASISSTGATILWATNEAADSQVEFGTTTSYGSSTTWDTGMTLSHMRSLSGLAAGTTYNYRVKSRDAAGNLAVSGNYTFTTSVAPDTTPPVITGVTASNISSGGAAISWTTNEASDTQIEYGTTTAYGSSTTLNSSLTTAHSQAITGLMASTIYHYRVKSRDAAGNLAVSRDCTFATSGLTDTTPPVISGVTSSGISSGGAMISWTTNEAADTQIQYGKTSAYGSSTTLNGSLTTAHSQTLTGLTAGTTYKYRVKSRDAAGNLAVSGNYAFTTFAAPDTTPPVITGVTASNISSSGAKISWATNEAADTQVEYGPTAAYGSSTTLNGSMGTAHSQSLKGLTANTTYHYRVKSRDAAGNLAVSGDNTFTPGRRRAAPVISQITISQVTDRSATIDWVTDVPSDSVTEYSIPNQPVSKSALADLETRHSLTLNDLKKRSQYRFRVKSTDSEGNQAVSQELTFTTAVSGTSLLALPHFSSDAGQKGRKADVMTGMALVNSGAGPATLTFTAVDHFGNPVTGPGIINPVVRNLSPGTQFSMVDLKIFGEGFADSKSTEWVKVESTNSDVGGFFLAFDGRISFMDGAGFGYAVKHSVFTEIETAGSTKIEIANAGSNAADITFSLMKSDGTVRGRQTRTVSGNGSFSADMFRDLFQGIESDPTDYILLRSTENVQPFQVMQRRAGDIWSLAGQDATAGGTTLYSPQYMMGGPWRSNLSIVNLDSKPGIITLQLFGEDGVQEGMTRTIEMPANGKTVIDDPEFFTPLREGSINSGFVKIGSDGIRLTGSTVFGDGSGQFFSSALPLVYNLKNSIVYSHVVSNDKYFTGIAIVNPNLFAANVTIDVFAANGRLIDRKLEVVPSMQKSSRLLTEYFPLLTGRELSSGFIRLSSDRPVASFTLFGTKDLSVLSAIPAQ